MRGAFSKTYLVVFCPGTRLRMNAEGIRKQATFNLTFGATEVTATKKSDADNN